MIPAEYQPANAQLQPTKTVSGTVGVVASSVRLSFADKPTDWDNRRTQSDDSAHPLLTQPTLQPLSSSLDASLSQCVCVCVRVCCMLLFGS